MQKDRSCAGLCVAPPIYSHVMAAPPDLASLAKRYVDLWQDQLIAMAADPDLASMFARVVGELSPTAADGRGRPQAAGSKASAAAPGERGDSLGEFARRLAAIEERLAALEARTRSGRKRASPKRRRRSS